MIQQAVCLSFSHPPNLYSFLFLHIISGLECLNKKEMTEIMLYGLPPALVEIMMQAVMNLQGKELTWADAKSRLGDRQQQCCVQQGWIKVEFGKETKEM